MNQEELLALLRTAFRKFRSSVWFRVTYVVILGGIVSQLSAFTTSAIACLFVFLMPLTVFLIPYYFGERRVRHLALNALPVFVIAMLIIGAQDTQSLLSKDEATELRSFVGPFSSPTMRLSNGSVMPYRGNPGETFTFRVNLTTADNDTPEAFNVALNLTVVDGFSIALQSYPMMQSRDPESSPNTKNGTWYEANLTLEDSISIYSFSVTDRESNWTFTVNDFGPTTASSGAFYGFFLYYFAFPAMILPVVFFFLILFMWWYSIRARETRARMLGRRPETSKAEPKPELEAPSKASKAATFTCTNCGADVSESDAKCPKCGAAFED